MYNNAMHSRFAFTAVLFSFTLLLSGCEWFSRSTEKAETKESLELVNVLDANLFQDCRIAGSVNVPYEQVIDYTQKNWNKDTTYIVVYCANYKCTASGDAAKKFRELGYKHVWAYEGGTAEWYQMSKKDSSYKMEGPCSAEVSGYLEDYKKPEGYTEDSTIAITAEQLKEKLSQFNK